MTEGFAVMGAGWGEQTKADAPPLSWWRRDQGSLYSNFNKGTAWKYANISRWRNIKVKLGLDLEVYQGKKI
jgi:hypothetical protein